MQDTAVEANEAIRAWADEHDDGTVWDFVCECDDPDCNRHLELTLALCDAVRGAGGEVKATDHGPALDGRVARARDARARALIVREEARAVRAQAQQAHRRVVAGRIAQDEVICAQCGYGVAVPNPPEACPMCRSNEWRLRR
jgi:rubrerythrin